MEEIDLDLLPEMGGADGGTVDLDSLPEITDNGEPSLGITETAQKDYEAATGAEAPQNPILAQIANMGLTVGGRLNANLQMRAAQKLAAGGNYDDRDMDDLMDQMVYGGVKKVSNALETVPSVVGPGAEMAMFFHGKQRQKQERVPNEIMRDWDETEGKTYKDPDERRVARMEYARQIATDFIRERSAVRQNAETELKNREVTHTANVVSRGLGMLGYTAPYLLGPVGILAQFAEEGSANAIGYANDEYGYDKGGNFVLVSRGDTPGRAALAGFGTAGFETATEVVGGKLGGAVLKRAGKIGGKTLESLAGKTVGRFPVVKKVGEAVGATAARFEATGVGRAAAKFGRGLSSVFKWTSKNFHLENPVEENIEEYESDLLNALTGFDRRASELVDPETGERTNPWGRFVDANREFFSAKHLVELNEAMLLTMGGGAFVAQCARRGAVREVDDFIREHELMGEAELKEASLEKKSAALDAWAQGLDEKETLAKINGASGWLDRLADKISGEGGKFAGEVNALREKMAAAEAYNTGAELDELELPHQKFDIPMVKDARGRNVPDFRRVSVLDVRSGETVERRAVFDDSGICISDNGKEGDSAYTVFMPGERTGRDFATLTQAVRFATTAKNARALDAAKDAMKRKFIGEIVRRDYGGANVIDVKTIGEAVEASRKLGQDVTAAEGFRTDRAGWRLKDGTVVLVRDNVHSPIQAARLLRHENVGHSEEMMRDPWLDSDADSQIGRLRDANLANAARGGGVTEAQKERILRESVANAVQRRRHAPGAGGRMAHGIREALRKAGFSLRMNDADLEVVAARVERGLREGADGSHVSQDAAAVKDLVQFMEPSAGTETGKQVQPSETEGKENGNEAGTVADEEPARPEQGTQGEGQEGKSAPATEETPVAAEGSPAMRTERDFLRVMHDNQKPVRVPVGEISLPDTQFKDGADPKTGIVKGQELKGEYFESAENAVVVYVRKDGTKELVTGRHRFDLAKRNGKNDILARVFREADGYTSEDMRNLDAISNIIDEKGTEHDYIRYFDSAKPTRAEAESAGFLSRPKGRNAYELFEGATEGTRAAIDWSGSGADGLISPEQAGIIAKAAPRDAHPRNGAVQRILVKKAQDGLRGDRLAIVARSLAEEAKRRKAPAADGETQLDLFTSEEDLALLALEEKRAARRVQKANEYGRVAGVLQTAMQKGGRLDLNKAYAKELGIRNPKDRKQLADARQKALEKAEYWRNAVRLDEADKAALDAELGIAPKENRTQRSEPVAGKPAKPTRPAKGTQASAPKAETAVFTGKDGTKEPIEGYVAPMEGDIAPKREVVVQHDTGAEINARQKILGTVKSIGGDRVTVGYRDPWGNEQSDTFSRSEIVGVKPLPQTRENGPVSAPKEAGATTPPRVAKPAEGRKSGDAAVLKENLTAETPAKPVAGGKMPKTLMVGGVPIENGFHNVTVEIEENGRTIRKSVTPEEAEAMGMVTYATLETKPAAPAPKAPKTPSVRMKDEAAERKAKAALDAIDFNTPELDGLKSKIRNGTILTEADQRQFAEDIRKGRMLYPRFRADEISASTGKEHGKLWQYILSLESARMDGRRARGGSEVYGRAALQVRRGGSEWGRVGTGSAQSPSVAYSPKYRKLDSGTESEVFDTGDGWVVKVRQIHPLSIGDVIDELAKVVYHNYLFPSEKYVLDDIVRHEHDGYREFYLILRQPFVTPKTENGRIVQPTYAQIWQLMKSRPQGFTFMDLSSRPAETDEYGGYSSSDGDEGEVVPAVKKVAYNRQFVVYDFQPGRNTFIDAKSGKVRFIDPRIDINDPGAGFRYSKYGTRRKFDGDVDFDTPELGVREKQTALSGGTSRNQNPSGNEYGRKWKIFRPGTRNVDIGAGRFDKATQFLADIGVENIPFDPVNRDGETNRRAAESVRANPADTATVHNVLNVIDNDSVMEGIVNQAARAIKKNGSAIFTIYEGNRSGVGARTRDGYQRNAKARSYEPTIKKFFGSVETHGNVILARRPKDIGPAFWAFDSSFENGINFDTPEFDPERFGKLVTGVGKLVDVLVESGHRDFKSLATYIYERDAEKYGRAKPVLQDIWNAVARARGLSRVGDAEAERVFGIIEAQEKEAENENVRRGVRGEVLAGEPAAGGGGSVGLVAGQSAAGGGERRSGGILAGGRVRTENPDARVDGKRPGGLPGRAPGVAGRGAPEEGASRGGETAPGDGAVGDRGGSGLGERASGRDRTEDGDQGGVSRVKKRADKAADATKPNPPRRDFVMTRSVEDAILEKNTAQRVRNNLDAIKLIRDLKARDYAATPEEQATLAKFVGWGGLREKVFGYALERAYDLERTGERDRAMSLLRRERVSQSAYDLHKELRSVLNDSEYESAKASASTAFYTPVDFVRVLHDALRNIGVKGGRFLGPSAGTGNFASAAGEYEKPVNWHFVEKDVMTGEMLKALFPNQRVTIGGFEETKFPDGFFDFAIDNVPYADVPISDRSLSSKMFKIHDYFFAKTLAKLRPGGVMAFLTSTGTLDKTSPILRQFLTEHGGKIVGAVRMPNGFFSENAGTDVASDLVVVQKVQGRPDNSAFEKGVEYGKTEEWVRRKGRIEKPLAYNGYFQNHPEQVIGTMEVASGQFGPTLKYTMPDGASMLEKVGNAVKNAFNGVDRDALLKSAAVAERQDHTPVYDKEGLRQGNVTMKDGKAFIKSGELLEPIALPNDRKLVNELKRRGRTPSGIVEGLLALRKAMRDVIDAQMSESDTVEADLAPLLANLNAVYDAFVQKNGTLHDRLISPFVLLDKADGNRMLALERVEKFKNEKTGKDESRIVKSDIFTKRVISRGQRATKADTPKDALVISYSESGAINVPRIAELLGVSGEEAVKKLKEGGDAFENPQTGLLEPSWVYLSGRVRAKLAAARAAVEAGEESFRANIEALEKVQPPMVRLEDAEIKFGATWVDTDCMKDFLRDAFGSESMHIMLGRNEVTGQWNVEFGRVMNEDPWGETSWSPQEFVSRVLNHGSMNHYETDPIDKKRHLDERKTEANKLAAEKLHSAFSQFVQSSDKWADPMYERYNAVMTDMVEIKLPNNVLPFRSAGMSEETLGKLFEGGDPNKPKKGREYQSAVISRGVLGGGSLCLAHCVGAGKTLEMQSIGVLGRHLGLFKKPMYIVPNHMLEQFANEFVEAFPNANILKMSEADVKPANRRAFFAQVANGDWDAIVVKHSTFSKKLAMSDEYQKEFMEAQRRDLVEAIAAMREAGEKISVDQATKKLERLEAKLKKLANAENHDSQIVPFEELGVDQLFVDEAHNFKGMPITTRQGRTGGLSQGDSQRAEDMQMKTQYVQSLHGGDRGVVFATGTPLSNAPVVEAYVMLKYLVPNKLDEQGLKHFDDFVDAFGRITTESEFSTDGKTVKERDKVSAFVNIPELMKLLRSAVDIVNSDQLDIPRPKPKYRMIDVDMSPAQEQIMEMVAREAAIPPTKEQRNKYLTLTRIAKNACLTPRLLGFEDGGNKIIRAVAEIKRVYDETTDNRGAQLVFTDIFNESEKTREMVDAYMAASDEKTRGVFESLARRGGKVGTYNLNEEIRDLLVAAGIPKEEIAIVQDIDKSKGDKDANKSALFAKVRSGEVRVLIGSRPKMGEGTNVQERLAAIHLLHPGWKPSEDEQAIGRIIRPGNTYKEGQIFYYLTKGNANIGSYETKNHQLIGVKSKLIDQVMHGDDSRREIDMDESAMDRDMLMGLASGNKALMELIDVKKRAHKLELNTESTLTSARRNKDKAEASGRILERKRGEFAQEQEGVKEWREKNDGKPFALTMPDGRSVEKVKDMAELVSGEMTRLLTKDRYDRAERTVLGDFNGVELVLAFDRYGDEKFKLAVPLLGVEREINYSGFVPDFTTAAMTAFKGRILEAVSPDYAKAYENSLNDMEHQAKKMSDDADKLQKDYEGMRGELIKLRTRQAQLEREVTPLVVQAVADRKVAAYGNWLIAKPGGGQYVARRESDAKSLSAPTVKVLIPLMDAEDFASPRNAATKTVDLRQRLKSDSKGETPMVSNIPVADVDFDTPELYTGSTADYERPSLHYVGTGEGSQAYGWGLYASNRRGVAESYAKAGVPRGRNLPFMRIISDNGTTRNGRGITLESVKEEAYADKNEYWSDKIAASTDNPIDARKDAKKYGREIEKYFNEHFHEYKFKYDSAPRSHLYEQTWFADRAPGDESHLLKWYEPVSEEQLTGIGDGASRLAVRKLPSGALNVGFERDGRFTPIGVEFSNGLTGEKLYGMLAKSLGSPKAASEFLARAGIDGVKYPVDSYGKAVKDGDEAGWNFVSFRDDNIRVDHKWTDGEIQFDTPELSPEGRREHDAVVARYTNADGTKKPGWMKAPNGRPTKLTERQWAQVRTPSFKKWFGDWERLAELHAARDFALNGEPVAEVSGNDFQKDPTGANTLIDRVADYFAKLGGKAESPDLGTVELTRTGVKSSIAHGIGAKKAAAFAAVKDVIEKGIVFDRNDDWKGRGYATAAIAAPIRMGGKDYVCELIVNRYKDRNAFYLHEVNLKEKLSDTIKTATGAVSIGESARPVTSIIAQRLAEVNPASVSRVVDENGEPQVVYHSTDADFTQFDRAKLGSSTERNGGNADMARIGFWFNDRDLSDTIVTDRSKTKAVFLNLMNPARTTFEELYDGFRDGGADGYIVKDTELGGMSYVALNPSQIKSATDNNGDFSGENPDIRFDSPELAPEARAREIASFTQRYYSRQRGLQRLAKPSADDFMDAAEGRWAKFRRIVQDKNLVIREVEERLGVTDKRESVYYAKDREFGLNEYQLGELQKRRVDPILDRLAETGASQRDFDLYLIARHAPYRNAVLRERGVTDGAGMGDAAAAEVIEGFNRLGVGDEFAAIADMVYAMNDEALQRRVDSGRVSPEEAETLRRTLVDYVPLRTDMENDERDAHNTYSSGWHQSEFQMARGRRTLADSPLAWSIVQAERSIRDANANRVRQTAAALVRKSAAMGKPIGEIIPGTQVRRRWAFNIGGEVLTLEELRDRTDLIFFKEDGKLKAIRMNVGANSLGNTFAKAVTDKDLVKFSKWFEWIPRLTRAMSAMRTQYVPTFIVRNLKADHIEVLLNVGSERGIVGGAKFFGRLVANEWRNRRDVRDYFRDGELRGRMKEFVENGGLTGGGMAAEGFSEAARRVDHTLRTTRGGVARKVAAAIPDAISLLNACAEFNTRVGVFSALRDEGVGVEDAVSYARDATVNFNRRGSLTPYLNAAFMFSNAAIQGLGRAFKSMRSEHGKQMVTLLFLIGFLQSLLDHFLGRDEDREKEGLSSARNLSEHEKQSTVGIPLPGGLRLKTQIRNPWALPMYAGRKAGELLLGWIDGKTAVADLASAAGGFVTEPVGGNGFGSVPEAMQTFAPTLLDPFVQWATGVDFKGDRRLRKNYSDNLPDSWNGRANTPDVYKWISQGLNAISGGSRFRKGEFDTSPENWQLLAETVLGGALADLNRAVSTVKDARLAALGAKPEQVLRDVPFVRDTLTNLPDVSSRYYDALSDYEADRTEYSGLARTDAGKAEAFATSHPWAVGSKNPVVGIVWNLGRAVQEAETPSDAAKLRREQLAEMAGFVRQMEEARKAGKRKEK